MSSRTKGFWKRAIEDWPAKLICLAAAVLLFFFYRLYRLEQRYVSVPLTVSANEEFVPANQYPASVRLLLRGEPDSLAGISETDIHAYVDLSTLHREGVYRVAVQIEKKGSALGVDPLEIRAEPADISFSMEKKASRVVPVTPQFKGYLEPGYELVSFDFSPSEVEVSGPASAVARLSEVPTDYIDLGGRKTDFTVRTRLLRKDPLVLVPTTESIEFRGTVQKSLAVKSFETVPISALNIAEDLELQSALPQGTLRLQSSKADLRGFELPQGALSVDLSEIRKAGTYTLSVTAQVPGDFALQSYSPNQVTLTLVEKRGGQP